MLLPSARRVVARFLFASDLPLGKTIEVGSVRIHRYATHFEITDLTNAGKRGKKVRVMTARPSRLYKGDPDGWMHRMSQAIPDYKTYDRIKGFLADVLEDFPGEIDIDESERRGVDVNPGGSEPIEVANASGISIKALPDKFTLVASYKLGGPDTPANDVGPDGGMYQDTLYYPQGKKDAAIFYNWLKANLAEVQSMTISDFRKLWRDLGVRYDYH